MDKVKFLKALSILHDEQKKAPDSEYNSGYAKALWDIMQIVDLCKSEKLKELRD